MNPALQMAQLIAGRQPADGRYRSPTPLEPAQVTAVTAGAAFGGTALVAVSWRGATVTARYLASYTPMVGDIVLVAHYDSAVYILGALIGQPI